MTRPRVLVIAEAANPEWVSVPLVGWSLATALRTVADVHVVTQVRNRDALLRAGEVEGESFTAIDSEAFAAPLWKLGARLRGGEGKGWTTLQLVNALSYPHFERLLWRQFGADIRAGQYDIVHRVTPLSPTIASPVAAKVAAAGVPFVLGPLNGGVPWPPGFDAERRREKEWLSYLRGAYKAMPGRRRSLHAAAAILAGSRHTRSELPQSVQGKMLFLPENAVDPARFSGRATPGEVFTGVFVGRMVPYKGPDMLLEAAAPLLRASRMRLEMVGDGPMLPDLRARAAALGVADAVTFHGWLEHAQVQDVMRRAHALTFPSVREFGGGVVLEAMALGVVPMIVDYAGPAELVTPQTAITVPLGTRQEIVARFAAALEKAAANPAALAPMAEAGAARVVAVFTWEAKARQVARVYDWVLGRAEKPEALL